jgi:hypothetical protein
MLFKQIVLISLFLLIAQFGIAQDLLSEVDEERLVNPVVVEYLHNQLDQNITAFKDIEPSLKPDDDVSGYKKQVLDYYIKGNPDFALKNYINSLTGKAWNNRKMRMNLVFSKKTGTLHYNNDSLEPLDTEQIFYLNLSLLFGLYNLPMAFEITDIDKENFNLEFSYIKGNKSEGKQQIKFLKSRNGYTRIEHWTYYKSKSFLRDYLLYPYFHKKLTDNFHRNLRKSI